MKSYRCNLYAINIRYNHRDLKDTQPPARLIFVLKETQPSEIFIQATLEASKYLLYSYLQRL